MADTGVVDRWLSIALHGSDDFIDDVQGDRLFMISGMLANRQSLPETEMRVWYRIKEGKDEKNGRHEVPARTEVVCFGFIATAPVRSLTANDQNGQLLALEFPENFSIGDSRL